MSNFEYEEFGYCRGDFDQLVVHAKKYSKKEAVKIFNEEYDYKGLVAAEENISEGYVKWFIRPTQHMSGDWEAYDGGCYGFVDTKERGAFPVWVITLSELNALN